MIWAKYRNWLLLLVYIAFFLHTAIWHYWGIESIGHLGFGCLFGSLRDGVITAGTIFTLIVFFHALFFGGLFCGWFCHWGITQDVAFWIMKKFKIKPVMEHLDSKLIPWFWFLVMIGQVVFYWIYSGFPTSLSVNLSAQPVWFMVPRSILLITITTIISGFLLIFLFGERAFCRSICTFRLWFSWFEKFSPHKVRQIKSCSSCNSECTSSCPMGIEVAEEIKLLGQVKNQECVKCHICIGACPHQALKTTFKKTEFSKEGNPVINKGPLSSSVSLLQLFMAIIVVVLLGFKVGGNISLSLGYLIGFLIANSLWKKGISLFEILTIVLLTVAIYFKDDMNDATSLVKGLALLGIFLFILRKVPYKKGFEFIRESGATYRVPKPILALVILLGAFVGGKEIYGSLMIHKAREALKNKNYKEYATILDSCAGYYSDRAKAYFDLGKVQLTLNQNKEALENFKKSLDISFNQEVAEKTLDQLWLLKEYKLWEEFVEYLIAKKPQIPDFQVLRAQRFAYNNLAEAQTLFDKLEKSFPNSAKVAIGSGELSMIYNDFQAAKKKFEAAYKLDAKLACFPLANALRALGKFADAEKYYAQAIIVDPKNPFLWLDQGANFASQEKFEQAVISWKEALKIQPDFQEAKNNIALAHNIMAQMNREKLMR